MGVVLAFEENAGDKGHQSLVKESIKYAEEMGVSLQLGYPEPNCSDSRGNKVPKEKIKEHTENGS